MKTITVKSATNKLNKLNLTKNTVAYKMVVKIIEGKTYIRPCYTSGSGQFTSNQDHTAHICKILTDLGIEFILTNDSPRCGLTGNLITITTKIK